MGPDCYKIEVLHYLNPHLIWVEVVKCGRESKIYFEQIGIYGVLPMDTNMQFSQGPDVVMTMKRCTDWVPAATNAMANLLSNAEEVWFRPTYIDRRTSIFDDNTQKFGDIIIKTDSGEEFSVLEVLISSQFALHDEARFHETLYAGGVKTKLNYAMTLQVIKKLEQSFQRQDIPKENWLKALNEQTSVFLMSVSLENSIASRKVCNRESALLPNKLKDLELCKDIDDSSAGRACSTRSKTTTNQCSGLKKKLGFIEENIVVSKSKGILERTVPEMKITKKVPDQPCLNRSFDDDCEIDKQISPKENIHSNGHIKKSKTSKKNEYDMKRIAIGPPGLNPNKFIYKTFSLKDQDDEGPTGHLKLKCTNTPTSNEKRNISDDGTPSNNYCLKVQSENSSHHSQNNDVGKNFTEDGESSANCFKKQSESPKYSPPKSNEARNVSDGAGRYMKLQSEAPNRSPSSDGGTPSFSIQRKLQFLQEKLSRPDSTPGSNNSDIKSDLDSDDESISELVLKLNLTNTSSKTVEKTTHDVIDNKVVNSVNPFKNVDGSYSVFVDKLVSPILMVHSKKNNRIQALCNLRDIPFGSDIHIVLKNMSVTSPMRPQTISWHTILRGHSLFLISPPNSGKTMGYLPAVCRIVADSKNISDNFGPSCIIVCATSKSVSDVERICKMLLHGVKIFACYAGMDEMATATCLLNGCDLLICTPCPLVRLIQKDFGVDLRNLSTLVLDDCERLSDVYPTEIKFALIKIKEMLKVRANREWRVQHVVVSRIWCDVMSSLARKAPDSVICISAFQECVLYSKASTSVNFVKIQNKLTAVLDFLKDIDRSKKTVIVCRTDDEVDKLEKALTKLKYVVFACDNTMTVHDLYKLDLALAEYEEPVSGPILVCCDGNLTHLNVTNAHYLVHYSLPELFSMFSKRFSVLNDNYPSIFTNDSKNVKIKILLDDSNVEQLPKILEFIRRCTDAVPPVLDDISRRVLVDKDLTKAQALVPICGNLLSSGKCPDPWNCNERHGIFKKYDTPKDWMPKDGKITFKILHYHTAVSYSVKLLANITKSETKKYPQNFSLLSLKMGLYYSKEISRQPHGNLEVGDVCAVALKENLFERCQIMKILSRSPKGMPELVLIKLIDEEKYERTRSIHLYYLPDDLKKIETHVVRVILSNIQPEDRDVTFSELAKHMLKKTTEKDQDLYIRGQVALVIGNVVFVDTLEACQDLSSLNEVVVKDDLKKQLLDGHAIPHPDHIPTLQKLCDEVESAAKQVQIVEVPKVIKVLPKGEWAHFDSGEFMSVFYAYADSPGKFYIRLIKFRDCINLLLRDIKKYVAESPEPLEDINVGDIVLAKFPDDDTYERARIDNIIDDKKVECFFVDQGDLKEVYNRDLVAITERFITQLPFQAIECTLVGIQPVGDDWTEFSTNWFIDKCFDATGELKYLFAKYFIKDKAECTEGNKYSIALIDTYAVKDVIMNRLMIDLNLASENEDIDFLDQVNFKRSEPNVADDDTGVVEVMNSDSGNITPVENLLLKSPLRSVPLVDSDNDSNKSWDVNMSEQFLPMFDVKPTRAPPPPNTKVFNVDTPTKVKKISNSNDPPTQVDKVLNLNEPTTQVQVSNSNAPPEASKVSNFNKPTTVSNFKMLPPPQSGSLDSDDLSSVSSNVKSEYIQNVHLRKPKICWRQSKTNVSVKIQLIGVEDYQMIIKERFLKFFCVSNDVEYGFEFELYGGVDCDTCTHSNRGQYVLVSLCKIMKRNWLTLTRQSEGFKWIVYDVDSIEISDDESVQANKRDIIEANYDGLESDSDDDFQDDHKDIQYRADPPY